MHVFPHSFQSNEQAARFFARCAVKALYYEVALYPKPGLVSFIDSGAHSDMNGVLFYRSLFALRHYFYQISLPYHCQQSIVVLAQAAEVNLLDQVTQGVNTHRGAIFALGIMCSSLSSLWQRKKLFTPKDLKQQIINDWSYYLQFEHRDSPQSHGTKVRQKYLNVMGAKQIAIQGYQVVFDVLDILQCYSQSIHFGLSAYCYFLLNIEDTNILYRCGREGLSYAREKVAALLSYSDTPQFISLGIDVHHDFSNKNISPGGVADLLSIAYFLKQLFK